MRKRGHAYKHGQAGHPLYQTWKDMGRRCYAPNARGYDNYGGRGITVCDEWKDDPAQFIKDMGDRQEGTSLDRRDNDKGYSKENCRWATKEEQQNNRRNTHYLTHQGRTLSIGQWARELDVIPQLITSRLKCGWSVEKALTMPLREEAKQITYKGITKSVWEWGEALGSKRVVYQRLQRGWTLERALTTPTSTLIEE